MKKERPLQRHEGRLGMGGGCGVGMGSMEWGESGWGYRDAVSGSETAPTPAAGRKLHGCVWAPCSRTVGAPARAQLQLPQEHSP